MSDIKIIDAASDLTFDDDKGFIVQQAQNINDAFLTELNDHRQDTLNSSMGNMHRVACIPVAVIDKWIADGFDFWNEKNSTIVAKLKAEGLDFFITTSRRI